MKIRDFVVPTLVAGAALAAAGAASAAQVYNLDIDFWNGDSFDGTVSLSPSPDTGTDTVNGTFDYYVGFGHSRTLKSETIDTISTLGPVFGFYTSSLSGSVAHEFADITYVFNASGVAKPVLAWTGEGLDKSWAKSISLCPSAAPEPAEWALLMLGVFGMGAALRARRTAALATA